MDLVLRTVVIFAFILLLTRVMGRRELGSMEPFDLIVLVVIGDLVQQGVTQDDYSVTGAVLVVTTLGLLTVFISYLNYRVPRLRPILDGEPVVLLEDGRPIDRNLRRERITYEELRAAARLEGIGSLDKVRFAVLETNGAISFIQQQG
ncbi:MAG TPA: YetF domain-containing protein [Gaiellales bacterium]|jgi:uncharacterized membrane protein YcaP (DUF421 family)|nr:YetF domain-containing protein [Gaiellales bacterium]